MQLAHYFTATYCSSSHMKTPSCSSFIAFIHLICIVKTDKVIFFKKK